jgi:hypothetical protein
MQGESGECLMFPLRLSLVMDGPLSFSIGLQVKGKRDSILSDSYVYVPYPPPMTITVQRWSEAGKRSRKWYWEVHLPSGEVVCAGIQPTQDAALIRAGEESKLQRNIAFQCALAEAEEREQ